MSELDDLAASLPIDQLATRLGEDPAAVRSAVDAVLPALLGGLQANAQDPGGQASLVEALTQHDPSLATPPVDVDEVDTGDGEAIARHIFGGEQEQVVSRLGGVAGSSDLVGKLLPILAPIVLSYLARQAGGAAGGAAGGGALGSILSQVLGGAAQGTSDSRSSGSGADSVLGDLLGGLLGGGRRS